MIQRAMYWSCYLDSGGLDGTKFYQWKEAALEDQTQLRLQLEVGCADHLSMFLFIISSYSISSLQMVYAMLFFFLPYLIMALKKSTIEPLVCPADRLPWRMRLTCAPKPRKPWMPSVWREMRREDKIWTRSWQNSTTDSLSMDLF